MPPPNCRQRHRSPSAHAIVLAAWGIAIASLGACVSGEPKTAPLPPPAPAPDSVVITPLLEVMSSLPSVDPAGQAEAFQSIRDAAASTPTPSNRLKLALALATPDCSCSDPVAAQRQLSELLAMPETLLPGERLLATVELKEVEQRLVLQAENKRLRDEAPPDDREKLQAVNRRLTAESDENARLRKALDEARAKLEAITHIERSINDRSTGGTRTP
jgi:hypothetical protein